MAAIDDGFFISEIADAAENYQRDLDQRERLIVGVNEEETDEALGIPVLTVDPDGERHHLERLRRVREERDSGAVWDSLERLRKAATGTDNLMPPILDAVRDYATLGEMMRVLRDVWGEQKPSSSA